MRFNRVFIFSYHGNENFHTSFYRLKNLAKHLAKRNQVHFVHGSTGSHNPIDYNGNLINIPLNYNFGFIQKIYKWLMDSNLYAIAKLFLIVYYFFTGKEIYDLGRVFLDYIKKTNLNLNASDTVIVSYPSSAVHNLGYSLKKKFGCKLILDYRDPGIFGYQHIYESKLTYFLRRNLLKRREIRNLDHADAIIAISDSIAKLFPKRYAHKLHVVRNGFLIDQFKSDKLKFTNNMYKLVYLGTIHKLQLENKDFFKALRRFIDLNNLLPHHFSVRFIGTASHMGHGTAMLKEVIKHYKLDPYFVITNRMPIAEAYEHLYDANMFLHLKFGDRTEIITSKQYDYLAFQKPILLPVSDNGDLEQSINQYQAGFICNGLEDIVNTLNTQFELHRAQISNRVYRTDEELYELSRNGQMENFDKIIRALHHSEKHKKKMEKNIFSFLFLTK